MPGCALYVRPAKVGSGKRRLTVVVSVERRFLGSLVCVANDAHLATVELRSCDHRGKSRTGTVSDCEAHFASNGPVTTVRFQGVPPDFELRP